MQNDDRILPEMIEKDDQVWKYGLFRRKLEILDQAAEDLSRHQSCECHLGNPNREHCKWI
jgi:hypothetical protein